jgi:hypothetical protein
MGRIWSYGRVCRFSARLFRKKRAGRRWQRNNVYCSKQRFCWPRQRHGLLTDAARSTPSCLRFPQTINAPRTGNCFIQRVSFNQLAKAPPANLRSRSRLGKESMLSETCRATWPTRRARKLLAAAARGIAWDGDGKRVGDGARRGWHCICLGWAVRTCLALISWARHGESSYSGWSHCR